MVIFDGREGLSRRDLVQQRVIKHAGFSGVSIVSSRIVVCHGGYIRSSAIRHVSYPRPLPVIVKQANLNENH